MTLVRVFFLIFGLMVQHDIGPIVGGPHGPYVQVCPTASRLLVSYNMVVSKTRPVSCLCQQAS
jgi:hypothetical protein